MGMTQKEWETLKTLKMIERCAAGQREKPKELPNLNWSPVLGTASPSLRESLLKWLRR